MLTRPKSEAAWGRHICNRADIKVIERDYRMGPDYPFSMSMYGCWDAVKWTIVNAEMMNIEPRSVSIDGLSAGGQTTALLAHFARDEGIPLELQTIVVPVTDVRYCKKGLKLDTLNRPYQSVHLFHDVPWGPSGSQAVVREILAW